MTGENWEKLEAVAEKLGVGSVKNSEIRSDKLRELIEKLHYRLVVANPSQVTLPKAKFLQQKTRYCPMEEKLVNIETVCSSCYIRTYPTWNRCKSRIADMKGEVVER